MPAVPTVRVPAEAQIFADQLDAQPHSDGQRVLLVRSASVEVEARYDAASRAYWVHGFALHHDEKRSHAFAVRSAPHRRGFAAIATGLLRRGEPR